MAKKLDVMNSITPEKVIEKPSEEAMKSTASKLDRIMKEELKTVKGIFQFFECPGMSATITVKKYKNHMFVKEMTDGQEYEVPLYVARFLNGIDVLAEKLDGKIGTCSYPVHSHLVDKNGNPIVSAAKRKKRFGFQSLEFAGSASEAA